MWSVPWSQQLDPSGGARVDFEDRQQIVLGWRYKAQHTEDMALFQNIRKSATGRGLGCFLELCWLCWEGCLDLHD